MGTEAAAPFALPRTVDLALLAGSKRRTLVKAESVFTVGSEPLAMFRVISGAVQVSSIGIAGRELFLTTLVPGDWFGEVPVLDGLPRAYHARALSNTEIAIVVGGVFWTVTEAEPAVLLAVTRLVCKRFRMAMNWLDSSILMPLPARLAKQVLSLLPESDKPSSPQVLSLRQDLLAGHLGVSRQSINRQLKIWEKQGWITVGYRCISVHDAEALRNVLEQKPPAKH